MNEISGNQILERLAGIFAEYDAMAARLDRIRALCATKDPYATLFAADIREILDAPPVERLPEEQTLGTGLGREETELCVHALTMYEAERRARESWYREQGLPADADIQRVMLERTLALASRLAGRLEASA